nr:MAG TPA: hypothetical protein [Caudoviricetes sp.]
MMYFLTCTIILLKKISLSSFVEKKLCPMLSGFINSSTFSSV